MKPVSELAGFEMSVEELQAEIVKRQSILSKLPPAYPGLLGWCGEPPTGEQLAQRKELESEIGLLELEVHRQTVIAPVFNSGREFERVQHQTNAANKLHEPKHEALVHCRNLAASIWNTKDFENERIGEVARICLDDLRAKNMYCPKSKETIMKWLKEDSRKGLLAIPPEARKGGRPKEKPPPVPAEPPFSAGTGGYKSAM